jgi:putative restriction endonuclease
MANAVFIQNLNSIYKDNPGVSYHFPKKYLKMIEETVGDWVIFYESRKNNGAFGYTSVQKVLEVVPDPQKDNFFYAHLDEASLWDFEQIVPRAAPDGQAYENCLRHPVNGHPISGGANTAAVRRLKPSEFSAIVQAGLLQKSIPHPDTFPREGILPIQPGFEDNRADFEGAPLHFIREEILVSRKLRDSSFQRTVKAAYGGRCAISGLDLRNGGGRPEVQAAHIRPVSDRGPDTVRNGLALSGTLHWMFDRGLISIAENYQILISHNKVSVETVKRLINPGQKLLLPENERHYPHPEYLRYHREEIYGRAA